MRRLVDIFVVLTVIVAGAIVWRSGPSPEDAAASVAGVQSDLARLYERASYYGALDNSLETTRTLWPVAVMPEWFNGDLPTNTLLSGVPAGDNHRVVANPRPWLDVAPPGDDAAHPPDPVAVRSQQAQFWYNPNVGVFRARVAAHHAEDVALQLYNQLNGVELDELQRSTDPGRTPLGYTPGTTPSATLASREPAAVDRVTPNPSAAGRSSLFMSDRTTTAVEPVAEVVEEPPTRPTRRRLRTPAN